MNKILAVAFLLQSTSCVKMHNAATGFAEEIEKRKTFIETENDGAFVTVDVRNNEGDSDGKLTITTTEWTNYQRVMQEFEGLEPQDVPSAGEIARSWENMNAGKVQQQQMNREINEIQPQEEQDAGKVQQQQMNREACEYSADLVKEWQTAIAECSNFEELEKINRNLLRCMPKSEYDRIDKAYAARRQQLDNQQACADSAALVHQLEAIIEKCNSVKDLDDKYHCFLDKYQECMPKTEYDRIGKAYAARRQQLDNQQSWSATARGAAQWMSGGLARVGQRASQRFASLFDSKRAGAQAQDNSSHHQKDAPKANSTQNLRRTSQTPMEPEESSKTTPKEEDYKRTITVIGDKFPRDSLVYGSAYGKAPQKKFPDLNGGFDLHKDRVPDERIGNLDFDLDVWNAGSNAEQGLKAYGDNSDVIMFVAEATQGVRERVQDWIKWSQQIAPSKPIILVVANGNENEKWIGKIGNDIFAFVPITVKVGTHIGNIKKLYWKAVKATLQ